LNVLSYDENFKRYRIRILASKLESQRDALRELIDRALKRRRHATRGND